MKTMRVLCNFFNHPESPRVVPMDMLNEARALKNHDYTLDVLNERGGLSPMEIVANIEDVSFIELGQKHFIYDEDFFILELNKYLYGFENGFKIKREVNL